MPMAVVVVVDLVGVGSWELGRGTSRPRRQGYYVRPSTRSVRPLASMIVYYVLVVQFKV